jgi:disulfide bond formation protein DsbB
MTVTARNAMLLAAAGSLALLLGAFVFQALGYAPCKLCLWQRWPHAAAVIAGIAVLASRSHPALGWAGAAAAATTGGLGVFHAGVEQGWWTGPDTCTSAPIGNLTAEELLNQIMTAPLVRCDEIAWQFAGLSMAAWNAILSFALAGLWAWAAIRAARA